MPLTKILKLKSRIFNFALWIALSLLLIVANRLALFEQIETTSLDFRFKNFTIAERADSNIVLISIDGQSLEFANQNSTFWPWPREFYALVTDYLTACQVEQIIFDIQFYEPDYNRGDLDSYASDMKFAEALKSSGLVTLSGQAISDSTHKLNNELQAFQMENLPLSYPSEFTSASIPIKEFRENARSVGLINITPDSDGVIRRVPLFYKIQSQLYTQIAFNAWLQEQSQAVYSPRNIKINDSVIPLFDGKNYLINWYGKGGVGGVFKYIPFSALVQSAVASIYQEKPVLSSSLFAGKTVIIGATAPGLLDLKTTPAGKVTPGMEIWATILSNLNKSDFITIPSNYLIEIMLTLIVLLIIVSFSYLKALPAHLVLLSSIILIHLVIFLTWINNRLFLPWFIFIIAILVTYLIMLLLNYLAEGKAKSRLKRIFSRYVHPDLVDILIASSQDFELGGKEVEATVLFSDIYDFTTYCENKRPTQLVAELNAYFEKFTDIILSNHGMLDKFTGDGLMALFGSPLIRADHADLACKVALEHKKYADSLTTDDAVSFFSKKTRIGINTGTVIIGNIGSSQRADYTAIGDAVNLSARLEGVNKLFKTSIIIGETTREIVQHKYLCRELDRLKVKGKNEATTIYELIGEKENADAKIINLNEQYGKALKLYQEASFTEASIIFKDIHNSEYHDYPSLVMLERCDFLLKNPPQAWDGVFTLTVK